MRIIVLIFLLACIVSCTITNQKDVENEANEPMMSSLDSNDIGYKNSLEKSHQELPYFIEKIKTLNHEEIACVKIYIPQNEDEGGYFWLINPEFKNNNCKATIFEIPQEFGNLKPGMHLDFQIKEIQDWFILYNNGDMEGGYTLRHQRSTLPKGKREEFDIHMGVKKYI